MKSFAQAAAGKPGLFSSFGVAAQDPNAVLNDTRRAAVPRLNDSKYNALQREMGLVAFVGDIYEGQRVQYDVDNIKLQRQRIYDLSPQNAAKSLHGVAQFYVFCGPKTRKDKLDKTRDPVRFKAMLQVCHLEYEDGPRYTDFTCLLHQLVSVDMFTLMIIRMKYNKPAGDVSYVYADSDGKNQLIIRDSWFNSPDYSPMITSPAIAAHHEAFCKLHHDVINSGYEPEKKPEFDYSPQEKARADQSKLVPTEILEMEAKRISAVFAGTATPGMMDAILEAWAKFMGVDVNQGQ